MKPKNIQDYVVNKVIESLDEYKDKRIEYLEKVLRIEHVCYDTNCGCCKQFIVVNECGKSLRTHRHCEECNQIICLKCDYIYCDLCHNEISNYKF